MSDDVAADSAELAHAFVKACSRTATPVTIVTSADPSGGLGQTVSAFSRVSDDPPVLGVCIQQRSPINDVIAAGEEFNVSVLAAGQERVADTFAGREAPGRPRFSFLDEEWSGGRNGLPLLDGAAVAFECGLLGVQDVGTHFLYLGRVLRARHADAEPLVHLRGAYRTLAGERHEIART
ncbi:flavin reductase family protein [Prauserella halophila]|uniref:Flavin reductase family protein n=1 Tax=Prauserella halophila TaxID=185641 RepID=A0ABN1W3A3_9PSEU|nr:flavin reductase family protein [Prauserella halophila]MCP2236144.1 flavin reductase [Prauserella halophila]